MKYAISLSGGTGSFASACIANERGLDYEMVFADTKIEDEDLHRFLDDIEGALGKKIVRLADGRTPWHVFQDVGFIGNARTAHCSDILKRKVIRAWLDGSGLTPETGALVIGMGLDEPERLTRAQKAWSPWPVISLLADARWSNVDAQDCYRRYGIRRPRLYDLGFTHNNCGGFCVRAGHKAFKTLLTHFPERFSGHAQAEAVALATIKGARPILRDRVGGDTKGMTLAEFRERTPVTDEFDWGGCGCFTDSDQEAA